MIHSRAQREGEQKGSHSSPISQNTKAKDSYSSTGLLRIFFLRKKKKKYYFTTTLFGKENRNL